MKSASGVRARIYFLEPFENKINKCVARNRKIIIFWQTFLCRTFFSITNSLIYAVFLRDFVIIKKKIFFLRWLKDQNCVFDEMCIKFVCGEFFFITNNLYFIAIFSYKFLTFYLGGRQTEFDHYYSMKM